MEFHYQQKRITLRDFPGGLMVKTWTSDVWGMVKPLIRKLRSQVQRGVAKFFLKKTTRNGEVFTNNNI